MNYKAMRYMMTKYAWHATVCSVLILLSGSSAVSQQFNLHISKPSDNEKVPERPLIEGKTSNPTARIWVVVHPMKTSQYWVQPNVTVRQDNTWRTVIYVGRPGNIDVGEMFEIMAIANPRDPLKEGAVLDDWPAGESKSQVIQVTRK